MLAQLPLIHRTGSVLFLDDAIDYLELVGMVLPAAWHVELYSRPSAFLTRMSDEPARWENDVSLHLGMLERHRQGAPLIPLVLDYWAGHPERHALARVCVVDYAMPGMDGLAVLGSLVDWPGARVMLTGQAEDQIAIRAFNDGLIDQFVPKQRQQVAQVLVQTVSRLLQQPHARLDAAWRTALKPAQLNLLRDTTVDAQLEAFARQHWVEHVVIDEPFGLLGLRADGGCDWLALEPTGRLAELAETAASAGVEAGHVEAIQQARRLAAVELHQQLRLDGPVRTADAFAVGNEGLLVAARFPLTEADTGRRIAPYQHVLDAHSERQVQDA